MLLSAIYLHLLFMNKVGRYMLLLAYCLILTKVMSGCSGMVPTKEARTVDSLNILAYNYKYKDLDSSFYYADAAYSRATLYKQGKAEACNHMAFCAFIAMDFDRAEQTYKGVYALTKNELECLIADVGLMMIYQRVAQNKSYYDYRNSAIRRMKRIREDSSVFTDKHEIKRLTYAFSEFYIVSAIYNYYQQQQNEALLSLDEVNQNKVFRQDTNQNLYFNYIKGAAELFSDKNYNEKRLASFDALYNVYLVAFEGRYEYFIGNGLQGLADLMASPADYAFFLSRRRDALLHLDIPIDSLLPLRVGEKALDAFKDYGDIYQIAGAYVSISRYLNHHGGYAQALDSLSRALDYVNRHHNLYYHHPADTSDYLRSFMQGDTLYNEMRWITHEKVKTVPEWIARIREQLSVSYSGLGMKAESDYNRNIYLDILNDTRQDKELESRYAYLEAESAQLTILLLLVIAGFIVVIIFFWVFNKRSKLRNALYLEKLQHILTLCKDITTSIPMNMGVIQRELDRLFGDAKVTIEIDEEERPVLTARTRLKRSEQALFNILSPYVEWVADNEQTIALLSDERNQLEKQRYLFERHIIANKRENVVKKACLFIVNGITPFIDRILNEVDKLLKLGYMDKEQIKKDKYQYIDELVSIINEYNEILALWIKMKQGKLSLNVEVFSLKELFDLIAKGKRTFVMKGLQLHIEPNDYWIKADRALTLFMINTLVENARKYTPAGGEVSLFAEKREDGYVEISVKDTGIGLSQEDVTRILEEKVYDSRSIGLDSAPDAETLLLSKGSGFGLMNCKGIIDKYRKTNELFRGCLFSIESEPSKGSRFFFRLPLGQRRLYAILPFIFLATSMFCSCDYHAVYEQPFTTGFSIEAEIPDSVYEQLLDEASDYANAAYFANVERDYKMALQYIDTALIRLNEHYRQYGAGKSTELQLTSKAQPIEIDWWNKGFDTDYHVILDIRNEAAVAFLALKHLDEYKYNNEAYTALYKLQGEDHSLEMYCNDLERSAINKIIGILICILLLLILIVGYYFLSIRKRMINQDNLKQVLEINKKVYAASLLRTSDDAEALQREEDTLKAVPQRMVSEAYEAVNDLLGIDMLGLAVYSEATQHLLFASHPASNEMPEEVQRSFDNQQIVIANNLLALPLLVDMENEHSCVGVLLLEHAEGINAKTDRLLAELIATYMAIVVFNAVVKPATKFRDIESAHEEARRASWEESMLHVQNMVLDNCLSTIKHETIYYPSKIKQIIGRLNEDKLSPEAELDAMVSISELITYYKGVFTILSSCASRQLEEVTFRRTTIEVTDLFTHMDRYFKKMAKSLPFTLHLAIVPFQARVMGDVILLHYLLESLINEAIAHPISGDLRFSAREDGEYVRFIFTDSRRTKTQEELNLLFYPSLELMTTDNSQLSGTDYLICKQIIRDHDEFAGKRGCRINAEPCEEGGYTIYFTLPMRK